MYYYKYIVRENDFHDLPESVKRDLLIFINEQSLTDILDDHGDVMDPRNLNIALPHRHTLNNTIGMNKLQILLREYTEGNFSAVYCRKCGIRIVAYTRQQERSTISNELCVRCLSRRVGTPREPFKLTEIFK